MVVAMGKQCKGGKDNFVEYNKDNYSETGKPCDKIKIDNRSHILWQCLFAIPLLVMLIGLIGLVNLLYTSEFMIPDIYQNHSQAYNVDQDQDITETHARRAELTPTGADHEKVVSCYYNTPDPHKPSQLQLLPSNINPFLCTHINIAFAQVINNEIYLDDSQFNIVREVINLKNQNPNLKILLSVGGAGDSDGFSKMVVNHASRKTFIRSIKKILRNCTLDGIDLDWEFPAISVDSKLNRRERQHFSQLLREIRMEYIREKRNYLLTIAVAAPETIVDVSYDIDQINSYVDYANIMTYDFHFYTKFTPFTGHNSPLYARATERLFMATLNINYTVHMYLNKGLDSKKIVVGIPTYGHSFNLVNADNPDVGSPASGYGSLGSMGFVNLPDICMFLDKFENEIILKYDTSAKVPYMYRDEEWVSFEHTQSVIDKAQYVKDNNLGGAMIYSLNADDYKGICSGKPVAPLKFPLSQCVMNILLNNTMIMSKD